MKLYIEVTKRSPSGRFIDCVEFTEDEKFIQFAFETFPESFAKIMNDLYRDLDYPFDSRTISSVVEKDGDMFVIARHWWSTDSLYVEEADPEIVSI